MNRYPKYKSSGVEWIDTIPNHWELKRLKYVAMVQPSNVDKKSNEGETSVLLCNYMDVYKNEFIDDSISFMEATATENEIEKFKLEKGDVLVTKDSETPDDIANPTCVKSDFENVICAYHLTQIRPDRKKLLGEYLLRLFQENKFKAQFEVAANGVTRYGLSVSAFTDAFVPLPSIEEQTAIANFLNEKTFQITQLISNKEKLIQLLKEERAAVINEAISGKGKNWERKKLKYLTEIISKGTTPSTVGAEMLAEGEIRFLKAENILQSNVVSALPKNFIDENTNEILKRSELKENDVLIVIAGATIGKVAILQKDLVPANTNQAVCFVRLKNMELAKWIWFYLQSNTIKENIMLDAVQSAQPNLSMEKLGNFVILMPSAKERKDVEEQIQTETKRIDKMISKMETEIELMNEYKATLISETVTGKIKVTAN